MIRIAIFGADVSSYEAGISVDALCQGRAFLSAKISEGTYFADRSYAAFRDGARRNGTLFWSYHFLIQNESAQSQALWTRQHLGDLSVPVMVDVETTGNSKPTLNDVVAYIDACRSVGINARLVYYPRWFWAETGAPNLKPLIDRGCILVASSYTTSGAYPGDSWPGWNSYGGMAPAILQFTDHAQVAGSSVDMNAFRGSPAQLAALLHGGADMAALDVNDPNFQSLIWRVKALVDNLSTVEASPAKGEPNALAAKLAAIDAKLSALTGPVVDVKSLALALAPLLPAGVSAETIAAAVATHLSADLAKG